MMLPYSAADIVRQMNTSLAEGSTRPPRSLLSRLVLLVALVEVAALWSVAGALTSLI